MSPAEVDAIPTAPEYRDRQLVIYLIENKIIRGGCFLFLFGADSRNH